MEFGATIIGKFITAQEADGYINNLNLTSSMQAQETTIEDPQASLKPKIASFVFMKSDLLELLDNPDANALRIYVGRKPKGRDTQVLVAAYFDSTTGKVSNKFSADTSKAAIQYPGTVGAKSLLVNVSIISDDGDVESGDKDDA